jgi:hypothetical protein
LRIGATRRCSMSRDRPPRSSSRQRDTKVDSGRNCASAARPYLTLTWERLRFRPWFSTTEPNVTLDGSMDHLAVRRLQNTSCHRSTERNR